MSPRRANGEGTKPRRRPDGRYEAKIWVAYPDGERKRVGVYGATAGECRDKILALRNGGREGTLTKPNPSTVSAFLEQWLTDVVEPSRRAKTARGYRSAIKSALVPTIGTKRLQQLTPADVQRAITGDPGAPGARTRQLAYVVLHAALETAVKWGLVARNVCDAVDKPSVTKRPIAFLTPAEFDELMRNATDDRLRAIYPTFVLTGIRPGEAYALRWDHVDLAGAKLTVTSTLDAASRKAGETKTARGRRTIDLPAQLVAELKAHRARMRAEKRIDQLVFVETNGGAIRESNFTRRSWKALLIRTWGGREVPAPTKANPARTRIVPVRDYRLYDLRHTAATLMIAAGTHPRVMSERMGHASVSFTMDVYGHLLPTLGREAAAAIGDVLDGGRNSGIEVVAGGTVTALHKEKSLTE